MEAILSLDHTILRLIAELLVNDVLTPVMQFITALGNDGMIWILLALLCLLRPATRRTGISMLAALLLSLLVGNLLIKPLVARPRPFQQYADLIPLIAPPGEFSFPSGHASSSFAAATALFSHHKKTGAAALVLAALIAFSRLYVCVHFPSDVLCGSLLGILLGIAAVLLSNEICDRVHFSRFKH